MIVNICFVVDYVYVANDYSLFAVTLFNRIRN